MIYFKTNSMQIVKIGQIGIYYILHKKYNI